MSPIMPLYKDSNLTVQSQQPAQMLSHVHIGNDPSIIATFVHKITEHIHVAD